MIEGWQPEANVWTPLVDAAKTKPTVSTSKQHVVHELRIAAAGARTLVSKLRLSIRKHGTRWGASVWRFNAWGRCAGE